MKSLALETFYRDWARGEAKELSKVEAGYLLEDPVLHLATGPTSMLQPSIQQLSVQHLLHTRHPLGSGEEQKARDIGHVLPQSWTKNQATSRYASLVIDKESGAKDRPHGPVQRGIRTALLEEFCYH